MQFVSKPGLAGLPGDSADKERVDNLEQANQELQRLRKQLDRALGDLTDAVREAEVSLLGTLWLRYPKVWLYHRYCSDCGSMYYYLGRFV